MMNFFKAPGAGRKAVNILGIRGYPAAHGGFETFAARLAPYLRDRGWDVNVYCQLESGPDGKTASDFEDVLDGIGRVHLGNRRGSSTGSVFFDWQCVMDVMKRPGIDLVLGYNTAIFNILQRLKRRIVVMNMDGIEWKREKWSLPIKAWFYLNEFIGSHIANVPIADHPQIALHLHRHGCKRAVVIPYGGDSLAGQPTGPVENIGLTPGQYLITVARIEPENSILNIVRGFSRKPREFKLVVLGNFDGGNAYHSDVRSAASRDVLFPGAIYDTDRLASLRYHTLAYVHGHQVGGTNPSLVEALGAGNAIIAHDNHFNRWVAGDKQFYFANDDALSGHLDTLIAKPEHLNTAREAARQQHQAEFTWEKVLARYEGLLLGQLDAA